MKHCPLTFREVNRPTFFFTLAPISRYGRISETTELKEGQSKEPFHRKPEPDASGTSYGRYIITAPKPHWDPENPPPPPSGPNPAKADQIVSLDDEASHGGFYTDFVWIWNGSTVMSPDPHTHGFDEMIGIIGYPDDRDDPRKIDGDVSIMLGDEKHQITQSSLIYIPKGLRHCPITFNDLHRPVLVFTIGNTPMFSSNKQEGK